MTKFPDINIELEEYKLIVRTFFKLLKEKMINEGYVHGTRIGKFYLFKSNFRAKNIRLTIQYGFPIYSTSDVNYYVRWKKTRGKPFRFYKYNKGAKFVEYLKNAVINRETYDRIRFTKVDFNK